MEILYAYATLFRCADEWCLPFHLISMDVSAAFENLDPVRLDDQLALQSVPVVLPLPILRETLGLDGWATMGAIESPAFPVGRGMRQGGLATSTVWNCLLRRVVVVLERTWSREGERPVAWMPEFSYPILIYADNFYLIGSSVSSLCQRVGMVMSAVEGLSLVFGADSLEVPSNRYGGTGSSDWDQLGPLLLQRRQHNRAWRRFGLYRLHGSHGDASYAEGRSGLVPSWSGIAGCGIVGVSLLWGCALWRLSSALQ